MTSSRDRALRLLAPAALVAAFTFAACSSTRSAPPPAPRTTAATPPAASPPPAQSTTPPAGTPPRPAGERTGPRPFAEVVRGTRPDSGLFTIHRSDTKLLFQIADTLFGRDFLLVSSMASVPAGMGPFTTAGVTANEHVFRFERRGDRVLLRKMSFAQVAADSLPIAQSVQSNNFAPILASLPVQAKGPDSASVVVDVTNLYERDVPALSGLTAQQRTDFAVRRFDETRSFINYARAYPLNVEVRHTTTFEAGRPPSNADAGTISIEMHQSMVLLPREPMRPRYADDRVGFFAINQVNFGLREQRAATERFIRRWRLEPRDPAAYARGEVVPPVKPITYYVDPATPAEWRSCVIQGIDDWKGPFETAGFRDGIVAKLPPTPEEDPEWSPEDVRYTVVRWAASVTRNAMGPSVSDPRTGEIVDGDIVWYHNHLRSYRNWLMVQTGAANPLARQLPVDQGLMCEAIRAVIAHEIGHALGFPHNMAGSSAYPVDSLRVPSFARRMGVSPSIMDYARQNYIAQPGDGLVGTDFLRQIGPYDHYAVNWGYRVIPEASTAEAEKPVLHRWIMQHAGDPIYRFNAGTGIDPSAQTEDLGDDPVKASQLGLANLKRIAPNLRAWTTKPGEDYTDLQEMYGELVGQWNRHIGHVLMLVGGVYQHLKTSDQAGNVYTPVAPAKQRQAMRFLASEVFEAPTWLGNEAVLGRIEPTGGVERLTGLQANVLNGLLSNARMQRLADAEAKAPGGAYALPAFFDDLRVGIWTRATPDVHRRQLQRAHVERLATLLNPPALAAGAPAAAAAQQAVVLRSDIQPLVRAELQTLRQTAATAARGSDRLVRAHYEDVIARIDRALDPQD